MLWGLAHEGPGSLKNVAALLWGSSKPRAYAAIPQLTPEPLRREHSSFLNTLLRMLRPLSAPFGCADADSAWGSTCQSRSGCGR